MAAIAAVTLIVAAWCVLSAGPSGEARPRNEGGSAAAATSRPDFRPEPLPQATSNPTAIVASSGFVDAGFVGMRVRTVDTAGLPVAGARVYWSSATDADSESRTTSTATDRDGRCRLDGPGANRTVCVLAAGFAFAAVPIVAEPNDEVTVGLRRCPPLRVEARSITGSAVADLRVAISAAGASFSALLAESRPTMPVARVPVFKASTDPDGVASFLSLPEGDYQLHVVSDEHVSVDRPTGSPVRHAGPTVVSVTLAPVLVAAAQLAAADPRVDAMTLLDPVVRTNDQRRMLDVARPVLQMLAQRLKKRTGAPAALATIGFGKGSEVPEVANLKVRFVDDSRMTTDVACVAPRDFRSPAVIETLQHVVSDEVGEILVEVELKNGRSLAVPLRAHRDREAFTSTREFVSGVPVVLPVGDYRVAAAEAATGAWLIGPHKLSVRRGERTDHVIHPAEDVRMIDIAASHECRHAAIPATIRLSSGSGQLQVPTGTRRSFPILADVWKVDAEGFEVVGGAPIDLRHGDAGDHLLFEVVFRERSP